VSQPEGGRDVARAWPEPVQRVSSFIGRAAIDASIEEFSEGTPTAEDAARAAGCRLEQIVKTLVFVCDGEYALALIPGDRRADAAKVAAAMGAGEARVARGKEVLEATGFEPGAVAPFPTRVERIVMERTLLQHGAVWIGAGSPAHMARLSPTDLHELSRAHAADLVEPR
jgi:prolyl-tRNA editing enzyme YbaK/EbsC (Cys-tRNA(Pro) deacylase)